MIVAAAPAARAAVLVAALVAAGGCVVAAGDGAGLTWWTTHALDKVRPGDRPPRHLAPPAGAAAEAATATGVELTAAGNEFEPFQLVLRAEVAPLSAVDAELGDLVGPGGARIDRRHSTVYLERTVELSRPSSVAGGTGEWPDPLVPRTDAYAGERRNAFPFDLEPGRNQPLWIELYVPPGTPAGRYRAELSVTVGGEPRLVVPVGLEVWPFTLPSTASLRTSFGFSGPGALRQHRGRYTDDDDLRALTALYAEAALRHRLSLHGGTMAPPPFEFADGRAVVDWTATDRGLGPLLDGTLFGPDDPLPGARATSVDIVTSPALGDDERVMYWRAWADHGRERGWLDRMFVYLWDEPVPGDYPRVGRLGSLARRADPELPTLLTEQLVPELTGVVDLWTTLINCLEPRPGVDDGCGVTVPAEGYREARWRGASLWWYQSCASHGCDTVGGRDTEGWPSYVIDAPAMAHRILPWLAFERGIDGELYYNTVEAWGRGTDPWIDLYLHGGNGDGTLFYPGTPQAIGGETDVPVESLRLKLIREGLEDYEYLRLAAAAGGAARELATRRAAELAPRLWRWERDPAALYAAREALGRELARQTPEVST